MTQEEFANQLNLSTNFIYMIETGRREVSSRTILDICERFHVNREWLENGTGEMYSPTVDDDRIGAFIGDILSGQVDNDIRLRLLSALSRLEPAEWELLYKIAREWVENENGGQT